MALAHVAVGGKITAAIINAIIDLIGPGQGLTPVIPTTVSGGGASIGAGGTVTFSGAATGLTINGAFTSTYTDYLIKARFNSSSSGAAVTMNLVKAGTPNLTQCYWNGSTTVNSPSAITAATGNNQTAFTLVGGQNDTAMSSGGRLEIGSPMNASLNTEVASDMFGTNGTATTGIIWHGEHNVADAFDGIKFTGMNAGTIRIYGFNSN